MAKLEKEQTVTSPSQEELLALVAKLEAEKAELQESVTNLTVAQGEQADARTKAIEAAIAQFKKAESHKLTSPNTIPGVTRKPTTTKLSDGTVRVDF